jgi:hypothetical protein
MQRTSEDVAVRLELAEAVSEALGVTEGVVAADRLADGDDVPDAVSLLLGVVVSLELCGQGRGEDKQLS